MRIALGAMAALVVAGAALDAHAVQQDPREIVAILDGTQNFGTTRRAVNFYDVTDLSGGTVFNTTPLFSIWTGFEDSDGANFEDPDTIAVNPINGNVYLMAFDSGPAGVVDTVGDTQGDLDLYKLDYQAALSDFVANSRPAGTMYAPTLAADYQDNDGTPGPSAGDTGFQVAHPTAASTIFLGDVSDKIGEIGRTQGGSFFDRDLVYFDPATLAYVDNEQDSSDTAAEDHELRIISRTAGPAVVDASDANSILGGYNAQTSESWESDRIGVLNMDFVGGVATGFSEPEDIVGVDRNGVRGVWVAEGDGGGDDLSFFPLVGGAASGVAATTTTIDGLGNSRSLDENPEADTTTNDGDHDFIKLDASGNVVIGESGFFDALPGGEAGSGGTPSAEPSFQRLNVDSYSSTDVDLTAGDAWDDLDGVAGTEGFGAVGSDTAGDAGVASPAPTQLEGPAGSLANTFGGGSGLSLDDDANVTDGRFATLDANGLLYLFDPDSGGTPGVIADVYVIDTETGEIVYEELNAANHFTVEHGIRNFLRGDTDGDGDVDADDIDAFDAADTAGGLTEEGHDLTSDGVLTLGVAGSADSDELINTILDTQYGDADLDGDIDLLDFGALSANFGTGTGWAQGDFDFDNDVDLLDFGALSANFGFMSAPVAGSSAVPEPAALLLLSTVAGLVATRRSRR